MNRKVPVDSQMNYELKSDCIEGLYSTEFLYDILALRKAYLDGLAKKLEEEMKYAPAGKLHCSIKRRELCSGNEKRTVTDYLYYLRESEKESTGKYIRKRQIEVAEKLAQKEYDEKLVRLLKKEAEDIAGFLRENSKERLYDFYFNMAEGKRRLVKPELLDSAAYFEKWQQEKYEPMGFMEGVPYYMTKRKEKVRSKSEVIIANLLDEYGIPYKYETIIMRNGVVLARPDFTVMSMRKRKIIYWEHFGMMDDIQYSNKAIKKMNMYSLNGFYQGKNMIYTFESSGTPLDTEVVEQVIREYLL